MPRSLLIATTNPGKIREVAAALEGIGGPGAFEGSDSCEIVSLADRPPRAAVPEDGATFLENAVAKATGYGADHDGLTLADDSGLCVDALGGEPGARSARFGGQEFDDARRCRVLLERMAPVPDDRRIARFVCVLALARGSRLLATFEGSVEGRILRAPRGEGGFGYDPVFFHEPSGRTFAELTRQEKEAVSHRGQALRALREWLAGNPGAVE